MREIYLDNSATTKCFDDVAEVIGRCLTEDYGNPSSAHHLGVAAENKIKEAREVFAKKGFLTVTMKDIVDACQISRGGLYLYFDDTQQLSGKC